MISDYDPSDFISEAATKSGFELTLLDVPLKYFVELKLDKELTQQRRELVFVLSNTSDDIEISKSTFTLNEL